MTHGKTYNKSPRRINHKATKSKTNIGTTALERSVEQTTAGFKALLQLANFTLGPDATLNTEIHHRGVQLKLAYSWARPAILLAGKGRGGMFLFLLVSSLSFLFLFLPCPPLSSPLLSLLSLFSLSLGDDTK